MIKARAYALLLSRTIALGSAAALTGTGAWYFLHFSRGDGLGAIDVVRIGLVAITGFWLVWGMAPALVGTVLPKRPVRPNLTPPHGRTVVLVPIYNEDPLGTFSRVAAMNRGLVALGCDKTFDFAILSDSNSPAAIAGEATAYQRLLAEPFAEDRIFYRRRTHNVGKKAGNIEDFVAHSGAAYDYALVLDADSLMEPQTMVAMARRMDVEPGLGLLQTVPRVIGATTFFGRIMQFSAGYLSPVFARGATLFHGNEGPYWGHNAIFRMRAFAACCGLPVLSGTPPWGGPILSHDYIEAALLSRGGWRVALDPDLPGSFEEAPENLIEYAKRDRRWCQGNLQHRRLLAAPGFKVWSRFTLVQGIMAYLASPLWLMLLTVSIFAAALPISSLRTTDGNPAMPIWGLALGVAALLVVPKLLIVLRGAFDGTNKLFGGTVRALISVLGEIVFSTLLAPILLLLQSRAVFEIALGRDSGWPATARDSGRLDFATAWKATGWIVFVGVATIALVSVFVLGVLLWVLPAALPAAFAPLIVWASSLSGREGKAMVFKTDIERSGAPIIATQTAILAEWRSGNMDARIGVSAKETHNGAVLA